MDSAHDDIATVRQLRRTPKTDFIVKRNLRTESKQTWLEDAQALGKRTGPRPGKEIFTGSRIGERNNVFERIVFEVVRRTIAAEDADRTGALDVFLRSERPSNIERVIG